MTTVYLIRHSEPFRDLQGEMQSKDSLQVINEKYPLGVRGEKLAEQVANNEEFSNIDIVWTSNYVRAMSTAKYFANKNNLKVNVDDRFGERIQGILSWDELPKDYYERQFDDENYRFRNGECQREVVKRMREALFDVIRANKNKRVAIISHNTAITFLLKSLCEVTALKETKQLQFVFNNKVVYTGTLGFCETFKLEFDDSLNLCTISHIDLK